MFSAQILWTMPGRDRACNVAHDELWKESEYVILITPPPSFCLIQTLALDLLKRVYGKSVNTSSKPESIQAAEISRQQMPWTSLWNNRNYYLSSSVMAVHS